jgi:hypothetical protein
MTVELIERLRQVQIVGDQVTVPKDLWDSVLEFLFEDEGLSKAMDEADHDPALNKEDALKYLERMEESEC